MSWRVGMYALGARKYVRPSQLLASSAGLGWSSIAAEIRSHGVGEVAGITPPQLRSRALLELADRLDERAEAIALTLSREMGKTLQDAKWEAALSPSTLRYNAGTALSQTGTSAEIAPGIFATSMREPIGVAGIIIPWNSPLALLVRARGLRAMEEFQEVKTQIRVVAPAPAATFGTSRTVGSPSP